MLTDIIITGFGSTSPIDLEPRMLRRADAFSALAMVAAERAIANARLVIAECDPFRCGVIISSQLGGVTTLMEQHRVLSERGPERVSAFLIPKIIINSAAGNIAVRWGLKGPGLGLCDDAGSSESAIAEARRWIQAGLVDVVLAGSAEFISDDWPGSTTAVSEARVFVLEGTAHAARRGWTAPAR